MKKVLQIALFGFGCCLSTMSLAQGKFSSCSAAFVGNTRLVDMFKASGQCRLPASAKGELSVCTVALSPTKSTPIRKIGFTLAVRDSVTQTVHLFSKKTFRQIPVQHVLSTCKKGDRILLITTDNRYALPHNEILVQ
jgi:hypothetical protein